MRPEKTSFALPIIYKVKFNAETESQTDFLDAYLHRGIAWKPKKKKSKKGKGKKKKK